MATIGNKPGGKNKKRSLTAEETTNVNSKLNKGAMCPICSNIVRETQHAIFCDGTCKQWIHRQCASLTVDAYTKAGKSPHPFFIVYIVQCQIKNKKLTC